MMTIVSPATRPAETAHTPRTLLRYMAAASSVRGESNLLMRVDSGKTKRKLEWARDAMMILQLRVDVDVNGNAMSFRNVVKQQNRNGLLFNTDSIFFGFCLVSNRTQEGFSASVGSLLLQQVVSRLPLKVLTSTARCRAAAERE